MSPLWLLRLAKWARHPPSLRQLRIFGVVALAVAAIWGLDHVGLWPDWARMEPHRDRLPRL